VRLLFVRNQEARTSYETEAQRLGWSVRQLDRQIGSQFYERIALSQNKAAMLEKVENPEPIDVVTPEEAIKDPFILEFLDLKDEYSESSRSLLEIAPPMDGLNVVGAVVAPSPSHPFGLDMVGHNFVVIDKRLVTDRAFSVLLSDLPVQQLPHFRW
jgi:hypothetical protein